MAMFFTSYSLEFFLIYGFILLVFFAVLLLIIIITSLSIYKVFRTSKNEIQKIQLPERSDDDLQHH